MNEDENYNRTGPDANGVTLTDPLKRMTSLSELMHAGMEIPSPFMKDLFLKKQRIVGTRYQGGSDDLVEDLLPGSRVFFVAEPENSFDEHAVMALDSKGRKLGYIPRYENDIIAALLKSGKSFYGIVTEEQTNHKVSAPGTQKTPYSLLVDLYMREFRSPEEMSGIPRQGYLGSYAVTDFSLTENPEQRLSIYSIKVINGEEKDYFYRNASCIDRKEYAECIAAFQQFCGQLPIVGHGIGKKVLAMVEEACVVELGMPFSNQVIDTRKMALNHLPKARDTSLDGLAEQLGIDLSCETQEETRCRMVWELYCRIERAELEKQPAETVPAEDGKEEDLKGVM